MAKKLTKKQRQEILDWFDEFIRTIDSRIDAWKQTIPERFRDKLDKSPESLLVIGDYLMDQYATFNDARKAESLGLLNPVYTYIGEVHRLHYPGEGMWKPRLDIGPVTNEEADFFVKVGIADNGLFGGGHTPIGGVMYCIHMRDKEDIYRYFKGCCELTRKYLAVINKPKIPGRGGESYHFHLLKISENVTFDALAQKINEFFSGTYVSMTASYHNEQRLLIDAGDNFYFHIYHRQDSVVKSIAKQITKKYKGEVDTSTILQSDTIFEFWGDGDDDGEYINHHIELLQFFNSMGEFIIYDESANEIWEDY